MPRCRLPAAPDSLDTASPCTKTPPAFHARTPRSADGRTRGRADHSRGSGGTRARRSADSRRRPSPPPEKETSSDAPARSRTARSSPARAGDRIQRAAAWPAAERWPHPASVRRRRSEMMSTARHPDELGEGYGGPAAESDRLLASDPACSVMSEPRPWRPGGAGSVPGRAGGCAGGTAGGTGTSRNAMSELASRDQYSAGSFAISSAVNTGPSLQT
jgi:hypothetical protein